MTDRHRKRAALEPAVSLFEREAELAPPSRRPLSVSGGTALVVARAAGTALWSVSLLREWGSLQGDLDLEPGESGVVLGVLLGVQGLWMLLLLMLASMVWRGGNRARLLVMFGATASITASAVAYFATGEEITVRTTLLTLALDILILLALSSRDARAWTRRRRD
ncbi:MULTISPECIES: hypothetical protein [unclassified Leucobacter]|uniref:hypothetical protein n=1 Tax=unclassified Leucobacter TaxID=2621730 RepID=UPI00301759B3